eukprot:gene15463-biopygen23190
MPNSVTSFFYTASPPPFPPTGPQGLRKGCAGTVVGKLGQPPVPSAPSTRPGRAAGGGGRAARGADLRAGIRPGNPGNSRPPPPPAPRHPSAHPPTRAAQRLLLLHTRQKVCNSRLRKPGFAGRLQAPDFAGAVIPAAL